MLRDLDRIGARGVRRRPILIAIMFLLIVALALPLWSVFRAKPRPDAYWSENLKGEDGKRFIELSNQVGKLKSEGRWAEAVAAASTCLDLYTRYLPSDHYEIKTASEMLRELTLIASLPPAAREEMSQVEQIVPTIGKLANEGKIEEALREENRVYEIRHRLLGDKHVEVARGLIYVGVLEGELGRYADAEKTTRSALRLLESMLGQDHPEMAMAYNNFGVNLLKQGKYDEAEDLLKKALGIRLRQMGSHDLTARSHLNLVNYYTRRVKKTPGVDSPKWIEQARENLEGARKITKEHEQRTAKLKARLATASKTESTMIPSSVKTWEKEISELNEWIRGIEKEYGPRLRDLR